MKKMKPLPAFGVVVIAVLASVLTVFLLGPARGGQTAGVEQPAYARVMASGTLRCGFAAWPPYFNYDPATQEVTGFAKDFIDKAVKLLALKVEYVPLNIVTAVADMQAGRVDALCFDGPWSIPAAKVVDYTQPWLYAPVYVYGKGVTAAVLNDPKTRFIGIDADISLDLVPHVFPKAHVKPLASGDYAMLFVEIDAGRADAVIIDEPSFRKYKENNRTEVELIMKEPLAVYPAGMSVNKGEQKLLNMLDMAVHMAVGMGIAEDIARQLDPSGRSIFPVKLPLQEAR